MYSLCACPHDGKPNVSLEPPPLNSSVQGQFDSGVLGILFLLIPPFSLFIGINFFRCADQLMTDQISLLRKNMRRKRARIGLRYRGKAARKTVNLVSDLSLFRNSQHLACYLAIGGELDCLLLIKYAWRQGKKIYLPLLQRANNEEPMRFVAYRPGMLLKQNRYGILEPVSSQSISPRALDLVLTPFVLCDKQLNRVGMGGGYYDRTFAFKKSSAQVLKPILLGIGYAFQQIVKLEPQQWDVKLDELVLVK